MKFTHAGFVAASRLFLVPWGTSVTVKVGRLFARWPINPKRNQGKLHPGPSPTGLAGEAGRPLAISDYGDRVRGAPNWRSGAAVGFIRW